ncbi:hypothetical protein [Halanaerobacter jeridensis]|uniref:Uncharacterized protein n=1 Tax=Halanaerobacter jeridensis TaxID=706427 RepID=A0A938XSD4_9FIRM|nr:hypothetical protein [Halanaerobacter jeridensis]MBM7556615.1 hypothetical protein [Halanaerobacter jeridensis]
MDENSEVITVRYKSYFKVNNDQAEEINPDDIEVDINTNNSNSEQKNQSKKQPNFLALTVLWACFTSCQQGILFLDKPLPWAEIDLNPENIESEKSNFNYEEWLAFLNNIVDKNWTDWISEPQEIKQRALTAYSQLSCDYSDSEAETDIKEKKEAQKLKEKIKNNIQARLEELETKEHIELKQDEILEKVKEKVIATLHS